ncbi:DUF6287 domain-containing protein [Lacticaseibacillus baoqingensis]|uniref:DUF6287 domain-containing protein n=1 Tax=Lacticaseibacillus baoqingensis TaxID=2486013 RepID=A0ABW4EA81_9LACO|nr:DUF6287 domain-containing protein [Lacticaseibacillus baoqingensis]
MKKIMGITTVALAVVLLAACGQQQSPAKSSSASKTSQTSSSKPKKAPKPKQTAMDLAAIKRGNYTSLVGKWSAIGSRSKNAALSTDVQSQMTATKQALTIGAVQLSKKTLTVDGEQHALAFKETQGTLVALLADADQAAINWSVTFYPKNTTTEFQTVTGESGKNQHNLVALWTSNNDMTIVYGEGMPAAAPAAASTSSAASSSSSSTAASAPAKPAPAAAGPALNLDQLAANNFASLVGTWKNPTTGDTWVVTGQTATAPAGANVDPNVGAVVSGHDSNGQPMVITAGARLTQNGTPMGSFGTFTTGPGSNMAPLAILPKGVKGSAADDSDSSKDRLISGGGQAGFAASAYYRVN